jgi:hypothetical protein
MIHLHVFILHYMYVYAAGAAASKSPGPENAQRSPEEKAAEYVTHAKLNQLAYLHPTTFQRQPLQWDPQPNMLVGLIGCLN